jgi:hypothetical protein
MLKVKNIKLIVLLNPIYELVFKTGKQNLFLLLN